MPSFLLIPCPHPSVFTPHSIFDDDPDDPDDPDEHDDNDDNDDNYDLKLIMRVVLPSFLLISHPHPSIFTPHDPFVL